MTLDLEAPLATRCWTAVKTRTRKEMPDHWCIGYSSKYNVGVGVGNLPARRMWNLSGMSGATPVWLEVMHWLHGNDSSASGSARGGVAQQPVEDPVAAQEALAMVESDAFIDFQTSVSYTCFRSMSNSKSDGQSKIGTERRLLEAAGEIFAEHGYQSATTRQICEKAGANIAAVNYHFGDKEGLYMAVLRSVPKAHAMKYPPNVGLNPQAGAEQKLRAYIQSLLQRVFDAGRPGWHTKIMTREMIEPTRALDMLVEEVARPIHRELASIVREVLGSAATKTAVRLCTLSILSQCVYYHHARPVIGRLYPEQSYGEESIEELADHITKFSLAALKAFSGQEDLPG
jgi:AcrR family transcriptional regulator